MKNVVVFILFLVLAINVNAQQTAIDYFANGNIRIVAYQHENFVERITYHDNGVIKEYASYLNAKPHGIWKNFNTSGELVSKGQFENGEKVGQWHFLSSSENALYKVSYLDDAVYSYAKVPLTED
jgi:antitoxin component YwqK of YwqJK toxin-antitoxin module